MTPEIIRLNRIEYKNYHWVGIEEGTNKEYCLSPSYKQPLYEAIAKNENIFTLRKDAKSMRWFEIDACLLPYFSIYPSLDVRVSKQTNFGTIVNKTNYIASLIHPQIDYGRLPKRKKEPKHSIDPVADIRRRITKTPKSVLVDLLDSSNVGGEESYTKYKTIFGPHIERRRTARKKHWNFELEYDLNIDIRDELKKRESKSTGNWRKKVNLEKNIVITLSCHAVVYEEKKEIVLSLSSPPFETFLVGKGSNVIEGVSNIDLSGNKNVIVFSEIKVDTLRKDFVRFYNGSIVTVDAKVKGTEHTLGIHVAYVPVGTPTTNTPSDV